MATICLTHFSMFSRRLIFLRLLSHASRSSTLKHFSSKETAPYKVTAPIKYTTHKAAKIPIAETLRIKEHKPVIEYHQYIIVGSLLIFLFYFCVLREENHIDEMLKGNSVTHSKELWDLKVKLKYCEINKLPTSAIRAKIEELEGEKKIVSPFPK